MSRMKRQTAVVDLLGVMIEMRSMNVSVNCRVEVLDGFDCASMLLMLLHLPRW
jgi:hypothetical protein